MYRLIIAALFILPLIVVPTDSATCAQSHQWVGCPEDDAVTVTGTRTIPGHTRTEPGTNTPPDTHPGTGTAPAAEPDPPEHLNPIAVDCESPTTPCALPTPHPDPTPHNNDTIPTITLHDLATFHPTPPTLTSEPDHTGIAGLPVNLTTTTGTQTLHGTLFHHPVTVHLTPHHYTFTHGDGTTTTTHTPGTPWTTTATPQFTPTDTSHTYTQPGHYQATLTIAYTPTITIQNTTQTIPGYLTTTSTPQTITIYQAHTALVAHTCTENPHAPGC